MLLEDDLDTGRTATVVVPDDQLSLAIGREGQNARLAAKLTGWRIDIKSVSEAATEAFEKLNQPPLNALQNEMPDLVAEVMRITEKKRTGRPIQPEEFRTLADFVKVTEHKLFELREAERSKRRAAMDTVRNLVPSRAYSMRIEELELDDDINQALGRIDNVGDLMVRLLGDEENLARTLKQGGAGDDAMEAIRYALDDLVVLGEPEPEPELEAVAPESGPEPEPSPLAEAEVEMLAGAEPVAPAEVTPLTEETDEAGLPAFFEPEPEFAPVLPEPPAKEDKAVRKPPIKRPVEEEEEEPVLENEEEIEERKRQTSKHKRRELVFDETRGQVVARRRRKGSRKRDEWEDYLEE
jgi:N utilization substance protein A